MIELMENAGCQVADLRVTGGQSRIPFWCQLRADITGKRVLLPEQEDSDLVGNACAGFHGLGKYNTLSEASERMTRFQKTILPNPANQRLYEDLYEAFKTAMNDLGGTFKLLSRE
jgi:sugar (pentulose or hexulose) kinase